MGRDAGTGRVQMQRLSQFSLELSAEATLAHRTPAAASPTLLWQANGSIRSHVGSTISQR